jgi:hypothetical protein
LDEARLDGGMPTSYVCSNARGLRQTARNMMDAGKGPQPALSIARQATENLVHAAKRLSPRNTAVGLLDVHHAITWSEIHAIATVIVNACCDAPSVSVQGGKSNGSQS